MTDQQKLDLINPCLRMLAEYNCMPELYKYEIISLVRFIKAITREVEQ